MQIPKLPILLAIIGGVTVLSVSALTTFDVAAGETPVNVIGGNLNIIDGNMIFTRTDSIQTNLNLRNTLAQTAIVFEDADSGSKYTLRLTPDGQRYQFLDFTGGVARVDLTIQRSTGNIGIGTLTPTEALDVNGNVRADNYFDNGNTQTGTDASALGGTGNVASNTGSTVGGGDSNTASGLA